jgi:TolB protein
MVRINDPAAVRTPAGGTDFRVLSALGAKYAVQATITPNGLHVVLYASDSGSVVEVKDYAIAERVLERDWRMRLHQISDGLNERITGKTGIAATRIAYVRNGSVYIIDSDGAFNIPVPVEQDAYSPSWHPSGQSIVYSTIGEASRVLSVDLRTGRSTVLVAARENVSYQSPVFSSDGSALYFTRSTSTGADIFRATPPAWQTQQITARARDNTQVTVSPSGDRLALTTSRTGHPEVFYINADGTGATHIYNWIDLAQDNAYRAEPDWSPDGQYLAFISQRGGRGAYQITVIRVRDGSSQVLTSEGVNEQPSWAPDSKHIVFTSDRSGVRQLWILDVETKRVRQLTRNAGSKLPSWSPRFEQQ